MDVSGDESKIQCRKEQYCIGIWNVRSMNEVKLDVVKQEMVRINIDILGISELKWTRMGKFNSVDHYIYYCGQESHRRNEVALIINKRVQNAWVGCNLKDNRMVLFHFQGKPFNITVIQAYAPTTEAKETEVSLKFLHSSVKTWKTSSRKTNTQKRCSVHHWELEHKSRKSRDT